MTIKHFLAALAVASLVAAPAMAQNTQNTKDTERNGHHYSGGPKTEVPHHMGKKESTDKKTTTGQSGGHHYSGGPATSTPHHMGDKKDQ